MPRGRKLPPLLLSDEQREHLEAWTRSTSMPRGFVLRARIVLAGAEGLTNTAVMERLGVLPHLGGEVAQVAPGARRAGSARRRSSGAAAHL